MTTGGVALRVAGLAATSTDGAARPVDLAIGAARAALADAGLTSADLAAAIHVGVRGLESSAGPVPIAASVKHAVAADHRCPAFDLMDGVCGVLSAMAVGASLIDGGASVLITAVDPVYADGAALVLSADLPSVTVAGTVDTIAPVVRGPRADHPVVGIVPLIRGGAAETIVLPAGAYTASPIIGLMRGRDSGYRDVLIVATAGAGERPTASVRCRIG